MSYDRLYVTSKCHTILLYIALHCVLLPTLPNKPILFTIYWRMKWNCTPGGDLHAVCKISNLLSLIYKNLFSNGFSVFIDTFTMINSGDATRCLFHRQRYDIYECLQSGTRQMIPGPGSEIAILDRKFHRCASYTRQNSACKEENFTVMPLHKLHVQQPVELWFQNDLIV